MNGIRQAGTGLLFLAILSTSTVACGATRGTAESGQQRGGGITPTASSTAGTPDAVWDQSVTVDYNSSFTLTRGLADVGTRGPAKSLVLVTVGRGEPVYATLDEARPTPGKLLPSGAGLEAIVTRFEVSVERVLAGDPPVNGVYARGGAIGPDRTRGPRLPGLVVGQRALLILGAPSTDPTGRGFPPVLSALPIRGSMVFASLLLGQGTDDLAAVRVADTYTLGKAPGRETADPPLPGYWVPLSTAIDRANALRASRHAPPLRAA